MKSFLPLKNFGMVFRFSRNRRFTTCALSETEFRRVLYNPISWSYKIPPSLVLPPLAPCHFQRIQILLYRLLKIILYNMILMKFHIIY